MGGFLDDILIDGTRDDTIYAHANAVLYGEVGNDTERRIAA